MAWSRVDSRLCMLYKIKHSLVDIPLGQFMNLQRDGVHFQTIYARANYTNFHFSLEPSVTGTNSQQMHFRLKICTCLKKTLSILPMSCPTTTNCYLLSAFILYYTNLVSSLFSPFLTNNTLYLFLHSRTQPISISIDGRL